MKAVLALCAGVLLAAVVFARWPVPTTSAGALTVPASSSPPGVLGAATVSMSAAQPWPASTGVPVTPIVERALAPPAARAEVFVAPLAAEASPDDFRATPQPTSRE